MSRSILHATDFSPASHAAFARAINMARRDHAQLLVAHVMTSPILITGDGYMSAATWDAIAKSYEKTSQKKLDTLVQKAKAAGARASGLLLDGTPTADAIIRAARARHVGTIVLGTHGRSGVARFFLGSVAGRVVAGATCPVLTVRGR
jgi:nucleotide-binding universal stress UspA family protein